MDYSDLNTAQLYFKPQIPVVVANRRDLHDIAVQFSQYYSIERLRSMPLEHYALGNDLPEEGFHLEFILGELNQMMSINIDIPRNSAVITLRLLKM